MLEPPVSPTFKPSMVCTSGKGALSYFLSMGDALEDDPDRIRRLRRAAAMRGDAPYLGIVPVPARSPSFKLPSTIEALRLQSLIHQPQKMSV